MTTVKGVWVFNDLLTFPVTVTQNNISVTSNGEQIIGIQVTSNSLNYYMTADSVTAYGRDTWANEAYKTVDFGETEQEVSDEFYTWLTTNATSQSAEEPEDILYSVHGSSLTAIGDAIRGKTGGTDSLTLEQMVTEIEGIESGGGSLDHTVTFKDDTGNDVAVYSVKNGVGGIYAPTGVAAKKWVDESGNDVVFPVDPISNMSISAYNAIVYSIDLYNLYEISKTDFPYLIVSWKTVNSGKKYIELAFVKTINTITESKIRGVGYRRFTIETTLDANFNDIFFYIMENKPTLGEEESYAHETPTTTTATTWTVWTHNIESAFAIDMDSL